MVKTSSKTARRNIAIVRNSHHPFSSLPLSSQTKNRLRQTRSIASPSKGQHVHRAKTSHKTPGRRVWTWAESALLTIVSLATICVVTAVISEASFDPERDAKATISQLAEDYYVEYLYPTTLGSYINSPAIILSRYTQAGLPIVRLRQILYQNDASSSSSSTLNNSFISCDINATTIRFYPVEPYGPRDYTVTYNYACENNLSSI